MAITLHLPSSQPPHQPALSFPSTNTPTAVVSFVRTSKPSHRLQRNQIFLPRIPSSSFRNGSNTPSGTECPVPLEQQPINEYQDLSTSFPFSWAAGDFVEYCSRLFVMGASFALLVGLPVAWLGAPLPESEPAKRALGAVSSGIVVVTLAVVRMYLGWAYVGNRLLSATVEYEETGWYDGQIWVKTAEILARDRLLGSFSSLKHATHRCNGSDYSHLLHSLVCRGRANVVLRYLCMTKYVHILCSVRIQRCI
ncbi:uncharacterized protein ycf36 isoform X2 [Rhodamnia argentea]|uniref:Uncharacterized protein ycf36 isoform X2 n=1 Tax=Rhodamnia argentea TaxID=178133 RepID=A0ABM3HC37_9MYRT|nr:uncharacterized protein ycf36 isoform X2 [Rhodamnia argentea]